MNKFLISASKKENWPHTNKEVCFIGRSNVGKSSLLNAIMHQKISFVSKRPGKTKLINYFDFNGNILVDLPGYGYAKISHASKSIMDKMVLEYFEERKQLLKTFVLIDSKIGVNTDDEILLNYLKEKNKDFFVVITKKDKSNQSESYKTQKQVEKFTTNFLMVSSKNNFKIPKLITIINSAFK